MFHRPSHYCFVFLCGRGITRCRAPESQVCILRISADIFLFCDAVFCPQMVFGDDIHCFAAQLAADGGGCYGVKVK